MSEVDFFRAGLALVFVLGLIGAMTWLARRMRLPGFGTTGAGRRLQVVESLVIDPRHKVVLVRADGVEHLLLLAPGSPLTLGSTSGAAPPGPEHHP